MVSPREAHTGALMPFDWRAKAISAPTGPKPTPRELHPADRPTILDHLRQLSAPRTEDAANRIARWFTTQPRGGVRAAEVADHLHLPLAQLTQPTMYERLAARGVLVLKVPGVRFVFFYLASEGMPDTVALRARWRQTEMPDGGSMPEMEERYGTLTKLNLIVGFLAKNRGATYTYQQIHDALGGNMVSPTTMKRERFERELERAGVTIVYTPDKRGPKGSRAYVIEATRPASGGGSL